MTLRQLALTSASALVLALSGCGGSPEGRTPVTFTAGGNDNSGDPTGGTDTDGAGGNDPSGQFNKDCFWVAQVDSSAANTLYPDKFAVYWTASVDIPPGGKIIFKGEYPHARYMSFHAYNPQLQPLDAIADEEINPDAGSVNTSIEGADRTASNRSYTVELIAAVPPDNLNARLANTLYSFQGSGNNRVASNKANIIFRTYIADTGADITGNVGLPRVIVENADTSQVAGTDACSASSGFSVPSTASTLQTADLPPLPSSASIGEFKINWLRFFNFSGSQANRFNATPAGQPLIDSSFNSSNTAGGFASNIHNAYIYTQFRHEADDNNPATYLVGAFEMKVPRTPATVNGDTTVSTGNHMRYWSVSTNENNQQAVVDGIYDEQTVPANGHADRRIFVVSRPGVDRPSNATAACGVNWLNWGPASGSIVIIRNMLSRNSFKQAIQQIEPLPEECEEPIMNPNYNDLNYQAGIAQDDSGSYFPYGSHYTKADFEALGCPVDPTLLNNISSQRQNRANCAPLAP